MEAQDSVYTYSVLANSTLNPSTPVAPPLTGYGQIAGANLNRSNILTPNPYGVVKPQSKNGYLGKRGGVVLGVEVLDPTLYNDPKYGQMFGAVAIYERVSIVLEGTAPFEEIVRPPWFSNNYANANIGANIYNPFFGCNSVVDDLTVLGVSSVSPIIENDPDSQNFTTALDPSAIIQQIQNNSNAGIIQSVQNSVNVLAYVYGQVKKKNLDVDQFIRSYVDRPIASMTEVLGSDDLDLSLDGNGNVVVNKGQLGFFSATLFSDFVYKGNFAGLMPNPSLGLKRADGTGSNKPLDPRLDIRDANLEKVVDYLAALTSHAFVG